MTLFPVILPIIQNGHKLSGKEKRTSLRRASREALRLSAEKSGVILGELSKDKKGAPLPFGDNYWSLSHKPGCVTAVVSKARIGIDIEEVKPRAESLFSYVANDKEWELSHEKSWDTLFRYWTAKEAILKSLGVGINKLSACRISSVPDDDHIILDYCCRIFRVQQLYYQNHIISILKDNDEIEWIIPEDFDPSVDMAKTRIFPDRF
jgi:4'-phosphopantetheinyl transferase